MAGQRVSRPSVDTATDGRNGNDFSDFQLSRFRRHLMAENRAADTRTDYIRSVERLAGYLKEQGMPLNPASLTREHVEAFIVAILEQWQPATAAFYFRSLQQYFKWLVDEGEIKASPMARMKVPRVPEKLVPIPKDDAVAVLLKVCSGQDFDSRRDRAMIRVMADTGVRRGGLVSMTIEGLDLDERTVKVFTKPQQELLLPLGKQAARDIDRYLAVRKRHPKGELPQLWIGRYGPMTGSGVYQMLRDRAKEAGIGHVHPHMFRHYFAHTMKVEGAQDEDIMRLGGWKSREMLAKYGKASADERARQVHRRLSPGDRLV